MQCSTSLTWLLGNKGGPSLGLTLNPKPRARGWGLPGEPRCHLDRKKVVAGCQAPALLLWCRVLNYWPKMLPGEKGISM